MKPVDVTDVGPADMTTTPSPESVVLRWTVSVDRHALLIFANDGANIAAGVELLAHASWAIRLLTRLHRLDRAAVIGAIGAFEDDAISVLQDCRFRLVNGEWRWLRISVRASCDPDGAVAYELIGTDITDLREFEHRLSESQATLNAKLIELQKTKGRLESQSDMLMETARELTAARDAAEDASRAKSEFLSNMSHELRTPLNAIIGFSEIIKEQTFGPVGSIKYRDYATDIFEAGVHLLELINEVLDFSKIESGMDELREEEIAVPDLIQSVQRMIADRARKSDVAIDVSIKDPLPLLRADRKKVRQILLNLLTNAIKFTEPGGTVSVAAWARDAGGFVLQVTDTGIGIALNDIPKALGSFGQVDSTFSRRHEGTGLGLPLTKAFAEMHGGSLDLQSQPGIGTTVTIRFPSERIVRDRTLAVVKSSDTA